MKSRNWVFTINNFTESDEQALENLENSPAVNRIIAEHEHLDSGTPHIQGYVSFFCAQYRQNVERFLGGHAFCEPAAGGWKQNAKYCSKENQVLVNKNCNMTDSSIPSSSRLTLDIITAAKNMDPWSFEDTYPLHWALHRNTILNVMMDSALRRVCNWDGDLKAKNYWIWGKPGVGKSRWASSHFPIQNQYKKAVNKWWDGYNIVVHRAVLLEDFPINGSIFSQHLKIWSDRYFFMAECKGSSMVVEPGRFFLIVTSNYPIESCFDQEEDKNAIKRRFTEIEFTSENRQLIDLLKIDKTILKQ